MNKKELGIYVHIPFCKQKCYYCDFISFSGIEDKEEEYVKAIEKEIDSYNLEKYCVTTIYLGGGTPSYLSAKSIEKILIKLKDKLKNNQLKWKKIEITIEVNPGTVTKEKLEGYKKLGINRLSIGLQATQDKLLKQIGRIHTYKEFEETYKNAEETGLKNINVDLMIGLPNQNIQDIKESLEKIVNLNPSHISVYSLIIEEGTLIKKLLEEGKLELPKEDEERRMYWYVKNFLELKGYNHYEISNFSKKGKESKHNLNCWNQKEYIGFGVAAHSYINGVRYSNTEKIQQYIENMKKIQNNKKAIYKIHEKQTIEDKQKEYMLLGLRKIEGVSIKKFKEKFIENPIFLFRKELESLIKEKLLEIDGDKIRLTNKGLDFANQVWEQFI